MPRAKLNNSNCTIKGFTNKFKELKYMTDIPHTVSTGNKFIDKSIARYGAKIANLAIRSPSGRMIVKAAEKAYPYVEKGAANIARTKAAYTESCRSRKKK